MYGRIALCDPGAKCVARLPDFWLSLSCVLVTQNVGRGRYVSAYQTISETYNIYQERAGDIVTTTLNNLCLLGSMLRFQEKYETAEEMNRRTLKKYEKMLRIEYPNTLINVNNLTSMLRY